MLTALTLIFLATVAGYIATFWFMDAARIPGAPLAVGARATPFWARLTVGGVLGQTAFGLIGFGVASGMGLSRASLWITAALTLAPPLAYVARRRAQAAPLILQNLRGGAASLRRPTRFGLSIALVYVLLAVFICGALRGALYFKPDGVYTSNHHNTGDIPLHIAIITDFAWGDNFPPEHPEYAGTRLTYPFLSDFTAAQFVTGDLGIARALWVQNVTLVLFLLGVFFYWAWRVTDENRVATVLTPPLALLNGGFGWFLLFRDRAEMGTPWREMLLAPSRDFTINNENGMRLGQALLPLRFGNMVTTLLATQRSMLLGVPLALIVITLWKTALDAYQYAPENGDNPETTRRATQSRRALLTAGVLTGLLPLAHAHTFLVLFLAGAGLAALTFRRQWRDWAMYFVVAGLIAGPQILWMQHGSAAHTGNFIGFYVGWDSGSDQFAANVAGAFRLRHNILPPVWTLASHLIRFWYQNTGLLIPLTLIALWGTWRKPGDNPPPFVPRSVALLYVPFLLCFLVPNFVKLAPWVWDGIKVLIYWYIASTPVVACLLARLWASRRIYVRALVPPLFFLLTVAGTLDIWRIAGRNHDQGTRTFDREGINFAQAVKRATPRHALILHSPIYDHALAISGRPSFMGYSGHLWTHGINYTDRETDMKKIYEGYPETPALLQKRHIAYVVFGPYEGYHAADAHWTLNQPYFEAHYPVAVTVGAYRLYDVR